MEGRLTRCKGSDWIALIGGDRAIAGLVERARHATGPSNCLRRRHSDRRSCARVSPLLTAEHQCCTESGNACAHDDNVVYNSELRSADEYMRRYYWK